MTPTREKVMPDPFGYVSDGFHDGLRFQKKPWPEMHMLVNSVAAVYSASQLLEAHAAGREQGLKEAKEVCEREAEGFGGIAAGPFATDFGKHTHNAMAAGAKNCAAAIEQLKEQQ